MLELLIVPGTEWRCVLFLLIKFFLFICIKFFGFIYINFFPYFWIEFFPFICINIFPFICINIFPYLYINFFSIPVIPQTHLRCPLLVILWAWISVPFLCDHQSVICQPHICLINIILCPYLHSFISFGQHFSTLFLGEWTVLSNFQSCCQLPFLVLDEDLLMQIFKRRRSLW